MSLGYLTFKISHFVRTFIVVIFVILIQVMALKLSASSSKITSTFFVTGHFNSLKFNVVNNLVDFKIKKLL